MACIERRYGLAPAAWNAFKLASKMAGISLDEHETCRVTQTIGDAPASAGFHARDGFVSPGAGMDKVAYCASMDLSVRNLTLAEIKAWLAALAWWGFAAWYRPWKNANGTPNHHIHAIYAGLPMKPELMGQVKDFLNDRTGLVGHDYETFYTAGPEQDGYIRRLFNWANAGGPNPGTPPKTPAPAGKPDTPVNLFYSLQIGKLKPPTLKAPTIDGSAWAPVRDFYAALGIFGPELVKWHPIPLEAGNPGAVYVQGRPVHGDVKLMTFGGVTSAYMKVRTLAEFSGLSIALDDSKRAIVVTRPL